MGHFQLSEAFIRLGAFALIFIAMAVFELWSPKLERAEMAGALKARRWFTNVSVLVISSVLLRVIFPAAAVGTAMWAEARGYGLLLLERMSDRWGVRRDDGFCVWFELSGPTHP